MSPTAKTHGTQAKFASFNWMRGVADDHAISIVHRLILIRLCLHRRNNDGQCSPGYDTIAEELRVHRASVFRAVDVAVARGWLAPPIRHGQANADFIFIFPHEVARERLHKVAPERPYEISKVAAGHSQSRRKRPLKSQRQRASEDESTAYARNGSQREKRTGKKVCRASRANTPTHAPDVASLDSKKGVAAKKKEESRATGAARANAGALAEGFAEFWRVYPQHNLVGRDAAEAAYRKVVESGGEPAAIIAAAQSYAVVERARIEREGKPWFTMQPVNWIKKGHWKDGPPPGAVIDQDGNIVAIEEEPQPQRKFTALEMALAMDPGPGWPEHERQTAREFAAALDRGRS